MIKNSLQKMCLSLVNALVDLALPPLCYACKQPVNDPGRLCTTCWSHLSFMGEPCCRQCGWSFPYETEALSEEHSHMICQSCATTPPLFQKSRSALIYEGNARKLILDFKHGNATYLSHLFAEWMVQSGHETLRDVDALIPIPLHWKRLINRGYNQSLLLCQSIHHKAQLPIETNWLKRSRATPSQGGLSKTQRQANMAKAFMVPSSSIDALKGKTVVLIDDVFTTGATLNACAQTLLKAGVHEARALTIARVRA